ncbi:MAG: BtrH N-terminal domain-containing protein [bacterium]|nr:BtrH N-terminal domain-containing protein [bacterium]
MENMIENIQWYSDRSAIENGDPGIIHSYIGSLATVIKHISGEIDPVWFMGVSGFAFRININEVFCPSAFSVFSFNDILPEAVEQMGYECIYVDRLWDDGDVEEEKASEAYEKIKEYIDKGVPAVAWDIAHVEWGVICGYDDEKKQYLILTCDGKPSTLPFDKLGKNGIDILAVNIPGGKNKRTGDEIIRHSLQAAVDHAEQKEWTERPNYQNGLAGYDLWALNFEKWKILIDGGVAHKLSEGLAGAARFYAAMYYGARRYAGKYLKMIANGNEILENAAGSYDETAGNLKPLWDFFKNPLPPDSDNCKYFAECIRKARASEEKGVGQISEYLS